MPEIPSEETIYQCADALYSVLAEAVQQRDVRQRLLKALDNHDLAETPYLDFVQNEGVSRDIAPVL